jgi:general secretion pathway protein A
MYESFFGLRERPFDLTPNPRFIYLSGCHLEALSVVHYGLVGRKGITLVIGEAGTGKTMVIRTALEAVAEPAARCVYLSNPALTRGEFYEFLAASFGLPPDAGGSKARFLLEFEPWLLQRNTARQLTALVIDEAQSLSLDLLEEVRLLANLETLTDKILPVVMAGQPEFADRLDQLELRHLKQRVALRADLTPLGPPQVAAYIAGRIRKAGGDPLAAFSKEAVILISRRSRGIPRTISVICDNAMLAAYAAGVKPIGSEIVEEVARDFRLHDLGQGAAGGNGSSDASRPRPDAPDRPRPWEADGQNRTFKRRPLRPEAAEPQR